MRDGKFHVFHKTVIDWLTGEIAADSSVKERSEVYRLDRNEGHAALANGFVEWLGKRDPAARNEATDPIASYWLRHGVVHLCRANGQAAKAVEVYSTDLTLLTQRVDAGYLASVANDYVELNRCEGAELAAATEMRRFMGKYTNVLQQERGKAVMQLALQQPDSSHIFQLTPKTQPAGTIKWRNKSQEKDACIATLSHKAGVQALAVTATRLVSGSGNSIFVYDAQTEELLEELVGTSEVKSVAMYEASQAADSLIVAGYQDGTIRVYDGAFLDRSRMVYSSRPRGQVLAPSTPMLTL